mgnify:CR=1 FL=1
MTNLKDTLQVGLANGSAIGFSITDCNEVLTLVSLTLAIVFTIYKFIKFEKNKDNQRSISCIPTGEYKVRLRYPRESATREYLHLLVQEVKDRSFILFHRGNSAKDTRGCILVGQGSQHNIVHNSTLAMDLLIKEIINLGGTNINLIIKNK